MSKKRKHGEPPAKGAASIGAGAGALPPAKKPAVGTATSTKPTTVKKETKPLATAGSTGTTVKGAGTDTGFFSGPKPKPRLPSFKKAPAPPKTADGDVAQPSNVDPFQDILKSMKRKDASPAVVTPPALAQSPLQGQQQQPSHAGPLGKSGGKKKSVTWAADSELESIRYIERAVYDDDPKDVGWISLLVSFLSMMRFNVIWLDRAHMLICETWIGVRELRCMHRSSKKSSIGQSLFVRGYLVKIRRRRICS